MFVAAQVAARQVALTRPYTIARHATDAVEMAFLRLRAADGLDGYGMAAPAQEVTGESPEQSVAALAEFAATGCAGQAGPGARAAIDMALCDLMAKRAGVPCALQLGQVHHAMPTSITIGVKDVAATLNEAAEYLARGFRVLKVKVGLDVAEDIERLTKLREQYGTTIELLADGNQGYGEPELLRFCAATTALDLRMIEQPLPPGNEAFLRSLSPAIRRLLCADESVLDARGLLRLAETGCPYGIINIKLQKCGGITPALALARHCERLGLAVMWGCNDESCLGIAAALHAAFASRATRFLDLDGSLDLAADPLVGGFALADGVMRLAAGAGLGASLDVAQGLFADLA